MRIVLLAVGTAGLLAGTSAMAQQAAQPADGDASSYLCTFAGKCGDAAAEDATPTRAAPATKGFRLAPTQQTPTAAAPPTRGFRLAPARQVAQPTAPAPSTRSFHIVRPTTATASAAQPRAARPAPRRYVATNTRPAPTPGTVTPRADLMLSFDLNSANMTPAAEARARTFARALMMDELRTKRFLIEGHTDARGSRTANVELSRRRAQAVADFLIAQGVDRSRVEVRGVGPDQPLPGEARASEANRRVEAVLLS